MNVEIDWTIGAGDLVASIVASIALVIAIADARRARRRDREVAQREEDAAKVADLLVTWETRGPSERFLVLENRGPAHAFELDLDFTDGRGNDYTGAGWDLESLTRPTGELEFGMLPLEFVPAESILRMRFHATPWTETVGWFNVQLTWSDGREGRQSRGFHLDVYG